VEEAKGVWFGEASSVDTNPSCPATLPTQSRCRRSGWRSALDRPRRPAFTNSPILARSASKSASSNANNFTCLPSLQKIPRIAHQCYLLLNKPGRTSRSFFPGNQCAGSNRPQTQRLNSPGAAHSRSVLVRAVPCRFPVFSPLPIQRFNAFTFFPKTQNPQPRPSPPRPHPHFAAPPKIDFLFPVRTPLPRSHPSA
jgi:hypothetical protein